jgi:hypothetical protein
MTSEATIVTPDIGRAIAQAVSRWLPTAAARVRTRVWHVGFVSVKVALGPIFSEYFGFPGQSSFHQLLHNHPHLSSGACTIGQKWPQYLVDLVPRHKKKLRIFEPYTEH